MGWVTGVEPFSPRFDKQLTACELWSQSVEHLAFVTAFGVRSVPVASARVDSIRGDIILETATTHHLLSEGARPAVESLILCSSVSRLSLRSTLLCGAPALTRSARRLGWHECRPSTSSWLTECGSPAADDRSVQAIARRPSGAAAVSRASSAPTVLLNTNARSVGEANSYRQTFKYIDLRASSIDELVLRPTRDHSGGSAIEPKIEPTRHVTRCRLFSLVRSCSDAS